MAPSQHGTCTGKTCGMVRLVIDTSIVHKGGFYLRSGGWPMLLAAARLGRVRLCVPEVVVRETVARYRREILDAQRLINRGDRSLRKLSQDQLPQHVVEHEEISAQVAAYESWLRDTVQEHGEVLPLPAVEHGVLVDGVLAARKPFSSGEKGYRDALIWHTVLGAAGDEALTFVTSNTKDFLDPEGGALADDLVEDLRTSSVDPNRVRPLTSLAPLLDEQLPEDTHASNFFVLFAQSSAGKLRLRSLVDSFFDKEQRVTLVTIAGALPERVLDQDIEGVQTAVKLSAATARAMDDNTYLVSGRIESRAFIGGIVWGRDAFPAGWEVWDTVGEQEYVTFPNPQPVSLEFSARFTPPDHLDDLRLDGATLLVEELEPAPPRPRGAPPLPGSPALDQARWVRSEVGHLLDLDARNFHWAVRNEAFVNDLSSVLADLEPSVEEWVTPPDSVALAVDNLASVLEDPAGVRRMLESLGGLIEGLELGH